MKLRHRNMALVEAIASCSARYKKTAIAGWILLVAVSIVAGSHFGTKSSSKSYDPGQSGVAERVLNRPGVQQPDDESVLIQSRTGTFARDPLMRHAVSDVVTALKGVPGSAARIESPLTTPGLVNGRSALVTFQVAGNPDNDGTAVVGALNAVAAVQRHYPGLTVAEAGDASVKHSSNSVVDKDFRKAEVISLPLTLILLVLIFGALIAAGIPLLLAGTSVVAAISLLAIPGRWMAIDSTTSSIVLLVGMAVGIDYSLFYLRRVREERARGHRTDQAVRTAARTSGRAVVVSGLTVMISLAGLFLTGTSVFEGVATGTLIVVGAAVLGSVTFLPAMLSLLGGWTDRARVPFLGRRRAAARRSRLWHGTVRAVVARPLITGGLATAALAVIAAPALSLTLQDPGIHDLPNSIPVVRTLEAIQTAFPGGPLPAEVVVTGSDLTGPAVTAAVDGIRGYAGHGAINDPIRSTLLGHGTVLLVSVPLTGDGTNATSEHALTALRDTILPDTLGKAGGVSYAVTGQTAGSHDFDAQLSSRTPWVFAFVLGLAFLLLAVMFRSVAIPAVSILLNLLSVGAAYGLMTWIFQDGHFQRQLGFTSFGGITPWMPLFMFVLLFGLSMDYHVFILSRIHELRRRGETARDAITEGIAGSAGVVTSAAVIMVAVFSIFATLSIFEFKVFGIAMSAAVLIDATLVRGVLLPASLALLGDRVWRQKKIPPVPSSVPEPYGALR
jgi:RND superfamily putative drug exporter